MFKDKKVVVVMPAYNAARTLRRTYEELMDQGIVDRVIVVDDASQDDTVAGSLPDVRVHVHPANRFLTFVENLLIGAKLSEYYTGYRAFDRKLLEQLPLDKCSDDFVFDNQVLALIVWAGHTIAEITCPTTYFPEASSINLRRSIQYGVGCLLTALTFRLARRGLIRSRLFPAAAKGPGDGA